MLQPVAGPQLDFVATDHVERRFVVWTCAFVRPPPGRNVTVSPARTTDPTLGAVASTSLQSTAIAAIHVTIGKTVPSGR
jgi:hypothetical protein